MIRWATKEDVPALLVMAEQFMEEYYSETLPFNAESMTTLLEGLIENPSGFLLVSEHQEKVVGTIGVLAYDHPFTGQACSSELFWWMEPEARGNIDSMRLLRHAEKWVKTNRIPWMHMVAPNDRLKSFYKRLGYSELETHFYKKAAS